MPFDHASIKGIKKLADCPHHFFEDNFGNLLCKCFSRKTTSGGVSLNKSAYEAMLRVPVLTNDKKYIQLVNWTERRYWEGTIDDLPRHFVWDDRGTGPYTIIDPSDVGPWHPLSDDAVRAEEAGREKATEISSAAEASSASPGYKLIDLDLVLLTERERKNPQTNSLIAACKAKKGLQFKVTEDGLFAERKI